MRNAFQRLGLGLGLVLTLIPAASSAAERVELVDAAAWRYAVAEFPAAQNVPVAIRWLPLVNLSSTDTDDGLDTEASAARHDLGGLPLAVLERVLQARMRASGRLQIDGQARWQVQIAVREWQAPNTAFQSGSWLARIGGQTKRALNAMGVRHPDAAVTLHLQISDRQQRLPVRAMDVRVQLPDCVAQSAPWPLGADAETAQFAQSTVGKGALAAVNRSIEELLLHVGADYRAFAVQSVRGDAVFLNAQRGDLRIGDTLPVFHQDFPDRRLGTLKITSVRNDRASAFALDLAPGALTAGDEARQAIARNALLIQPADADSATAYVDCRAALRDLAYDDDQETTD